MLLLSLIIAEAALETVPRAIAKHPSVVRHAERKGKPAEVMLLDRSYHHGAMLKLENAERRGRPDLVHFALLEATSTPLYRKNQLNVYVHTAANKVILLSENVRLPKSYFRFEGLMEELFNNGKVSSDSSLLMELRDMKFQDLIGKLRPRKVIGLSRMGARSSAEKVAKMIDNDTAIVVGGFPRGHFSNMVSGKINYTYSISELALEAHLVIARVLYECEKILFK
ncbi:MAG: ribosome biogenesis protein [Nitrososphaerales archaeon]